MTNYQEARVKLAKYTIKQIKICSEKKTGTILRLNKKNFEDDELQRALFLTTR